MRKKTTKCVGKMIILSMLLCGLLVSGCGEREETKVEDATEETAESEETEEASEESAESEEAETPKPTVDKSYQNEYVVKEGDVELQKVEGYQYLGSSQLSKDDGEITCEVLTPMGWYTFADQDMVSSNMHGVNTLAKIIKLTPKNLDEKMQYYQESTYEFHVKNKSSYSNAQMGDIVPAEGKEKAYYAIITYDEESMSDDMWYPAASIEYLQGITENSALCYEITLKTENFDNYTETLLKELESAYGMDLSQFYLSDGEQGKGKTTEEIQEQRAVENAVRYVLVYDMHRQGVTAEDIAAWDLCRVNQLYADAYVCGYLTYEEAMEGSLQNSLVLQKQFSSWEEMLNSYMLGYQFWKNDPCISEDSPTMERWNCCEELMAMEGGPYTLNWNMKLEECW